MTPETEARFERIEAMMERFAEGQKGLQTAHIELEAAQRNTVKAIDRFVNETRQRFDDVGEKIANLTILVDRLVARI